ncbi:hypothetical protein ACH46N_32220 [Streptomyces pristinaespiralis]|uniref:Uncharacterized protein n=2 Tax=Streptomyces pristinaespiralis TaxID=38300 RepID=B5HFK9_STRE2|nr:hypothetical protein [Streptomyces pristinaespiralis]ALC20545.1 Hypothetical protein SPRI_2239 [Streptomyces pristinaespiralis]EDY65620.2 conserved hypothetical protein [Streptomyces pristinaespiralis ATCC 25486]QMU16609.1 hypothetical protein H3L99_25820 [Streptomyces pristinaespiralis]
MEREHTPRPAESGLSTDDIAAPLERDTGRGPEAQSPEFPGGTAEVRPEADASTSTAPEVTPEADAAPTAPGATPEADVSPTGASAVSEETEPAPDASAREEVPQLLTSEDEEGFRTRWQEIQNRFVDDPREAVHEADGLVADVMQTLASTFSQHKQDLEGQWSQGDEADTEDLRMALRKYRSFFNRLLSS